MHDIQHIRDVKPFQKPQDSIFSKLFTRKLSRVLTFLLLKVDAHVTPNKVSLFSFELAVLACVLFLYDAYVWRIIGVLLLQLSFAFDCSDGEISRIKNLSSKYGAWLDSVLDRFKEVLMLGSMTISWYLHVQHEAWVLIIGFMAIIGLQLVSYLREAKKSSWPSTRTSELFITKDIYIGTVDVTVYLVSFAVLIQWEIAALWLFLAVSIPLIVKQMRSAYRLGHKDI
jgi:CDP-L-myo-inositol myo-inositolphosphotransferase